MNHYVILDMHVPASTSDWMCNPSHRKHPAWEYHVELSQSPNKLEACEAIPYSSHTVWEVCFLPIFFLFSHLISVAGPGNHF